LPAFVDIVRSLLFRIFIFNTDMPSSRLLSKHQDVQAKIRAEIQETFGSSPAEVSITRQMPYLTNVLKKGKFKPSFITLDLASFKLNIGTNTSQFYVSILPSQQIQEQQQKMSSSQLAVVQTEIPSSSSKGRGCGSVCLLHAPSHRHVRSRCHCLPARQMGEWCA
jgi:hypothetical protein